ncbi:MAG: glycosyltransferase family 2 protein [Azonexus sp.]
MLRHSINQIKQSRRAARQWLHRLGMGFGIDDLKPTHQLQRIAEYSDNRFLSQGEDPQFRIGSKLTAGWYMAEVLADLPEVRANARFYVDFGAGESQKNSFGMVVRSGKLAKRLIYIKEAARLRFDPLEQAGEFRLLQFRLNKVSARFALSRIRRKLFNLHPRYRVDGDLSASNNTAFDEHVWADYNALFESHAPHALSYANWIRAVETPQIPDRESQLLGMRQWAYRPSFSIILPTYNTPEAHLRACLDSVIDQTYPHWELCVADDASSKPHVREILSEYAARDSRIRLAFRDSNGHISAASNTALTLASGDYIALLDHDDTLASHALYANACAIQRQPQAQLLYSDEDKLDENGERCDPFFKPDWSPDLLYSQNYIAHFSVYSRKLVESTGGFRSDFDGSQDYDLVLRSVAAIKDPTHIVHIPLALYHWRISENSTAGGHEQKHYASEAARKALQACFDASTDRVKVSITAPGVYRHRWSLPMPQPLVSLIIPTRDGHDHLKACIESIIRKTTYLHYEILLVDNQTTCGKTLSLMAELPKSSQGKVRVLPYDQPFNYSAINNYAAAQARGELIGLINNDIEVINGDWLSEMVSHAIRPDIGCVGAKLYYPDDTLQHCGVVLGIGGVAGHSHKHFPGSASGYFGRLRTIHNVSAVTGAALLIRKDSFDKVGGLDEALEIAFNDVDFCLRIARLGLRNLWTPFAELYHHESKTRGIENTPEKRTRFLREAQFMVARWGEMLAYDPYYNQNLTLSDESYALGGLVSELSGGAIFAQSD